ncbi:TonB-dependent siderophore receptor [Picosynechococcus sp. NKBG15041c]|uniref:TonB-dependent siderophore receptor n=1 Tax=Picosynechococcus sp. NKBG15041c TaxID=1407650 RepID=UPI000408C697|nr:TonB-dependent siderophore receptor [Picosynechococcus sp. NKBG15041c]
MHHWYRFLPVTGAFALVLVTQEVSALGVAEPPPEDVVETPAAIIAQAVTVITDVAIAQTGNQVELRLSATAALDNATVTQGAQGTEIIIPNATVIQPEVLQEFAPKSGLEQIEIRNQTDNNVQILIRSGDRQIQTQLTSTATGLTLNIEPAIVAAETDGGAIEAFELVVTDTEQPYNPASATTATGLDTALRDIPQSIQVIPQAVLRDRNVTELGEALETNGSIVSRGGRGTSVFGPGFLIRGFPSGSSIFRDGIGTVSLSALDTSDIERVEILKGPASVLFGQGAPGGVINLVSKEPLAEPFIGIEASVGSFANYRGNVDLSDALTEDGSARYRLNFSYGNFGSFRDLVDGERVVLSPRLSFDLSEKTSLDLYGQYAYTRETIDEGIPFTAAGPVDVPRRRFVGEDFGEFSEQRFDVGYDLGHEVNDYLSLRHRLQFLQYRPRRYAPLYTGFDETTGDVGRLAYFAGGHYQRFFTNIEAIATFETGSVKHQVLGGIEYRNTLEQPEFQFSNDYTPINVFNPVYTGIPYAIAPEFFRDDTIKTVGVYIQDQIEFSPQFKALAGLRYDFVEQLRSTQDLGGPRNEFFQSDGALSPRLGVVYQPIEPLSLYASYSQSFEPSFGASRNGDGSTFEPERGRQWEVGVKADFSDRLSFTAAAFDIRKQNISVQDPNNPLLSIQTGEQTSRGLEFNLNGELATGWNVTAAYTLMDAFVSEDTDPAFEGQRLPNVPQNQFSLWTTYDIPQGSLEGLGFGLGFFYVGDRPGTLDNAFTVPSYFRTDAAIYYRRDNWRAQLNFENLFNTEYFTAADEFQFATPGAPFAVTAKFALDF